MKIIKGGQIITSDALNAEYIASENIRKQNELDRIANEATRANVVEAIEVEYAPRLTGVESQLAENVTDLDKRVGLSAKKFGVKLDGITDDTIALNNFFKQFGTADLIIEDGIALVTGPLFLEGLWTPSTGNNNHHRKLIFKNASIKYMGTSGEPCLHIYNHQLSVIDGLAITRDSNDTYVNFASFWYSKVINFDVPMIAFNKNNADITGIDTLRSTASFTNAFSKGYVKGMCEFYSNGVAGATHVNSMTFNDVLFDGKTTQDYNFKFYGWSFQNFSFSGCDISYAKKSIMYVDIEQTANASCNFYNCYFDSAIPLIENQNLKSFTVNLDNCFEASGTISQMALVKTKNILSSSKLSNRSYEANSIPMGVMNLIKNGDLMKPTLDSSWVTFSNTAGTILANTSTINGNSLQVPFTAASQSVTFLALLAPAEGKYTSCIRLKKTGTAIVQINFGGIYTQYDLSKYADGEEIIISNRANGKNFLQTDQLWFSISAVATNFSNTTIEILEAIVVQGTHMLFNVPMHPRAVLYPIKIVPNGITSARPTINLVIGYLYFDTTLGCLICWNGTAWKNGVGATV